MKPPPSDRAEGKEIAVGEVRVRGTEFHATLTKLVDVEGEVSTADKRIITLAPLGAPVRRAILVHISVGVTAEALLSELHHRPFRAKGIAVSFAELSDFGRHIPLAREKDWERHMKAASRR